MSLTKFIRDVQSRFEAIPAPAAIVYNVTAAKILQKPERESKIKGILDQSKFKDSYQMELTDIWMKITLKKYR